MAIFRRPPRQASPHLNEGLDPRHIKHDDKPLMLRGQRSNLFPQPSRDTRATVRRDSPKCPHADLFDVRGRAWLAAQQLPDDERAAIDRHIRELDRLSEDLALLDREIAQDAIEDSAVNRLMTITSVNLAVMLGSWQRSATSAASTARTSW